MYTCCHQRLIRLTDHSLSSHQWVNRLCGGWKVYLRKIGWEKKLKSVTDIKIDVSYTFIEIVSFIFPAMEILHFLIVLAAGQNLSKLDLSELKFADCVELECPHLLPFLSTNYLALWSSGGEWKTVRWMIWWTSRGKEVIYLGFSSHELQHLGFILRIKKSRRSWCVPSSGSDWLVVLSITSSTRLLLQKLFYMATFACILVGRCFKIITKSVQLKLPTYLAGARLGKSFFFLFLCQLYSTQAFRISCWLLVPMILH